MALQMVLIEFTFRLKVYQISMHIAQVYVATTIRGVSEGCPINISLLQNEWNNIARDI
jgi:hypothetical protein